MSTSLSNVKGHQVLHQYSAAGPAYSSNFRFKKPIIAPLEIVSEATGDETDVGSSLSEASTGSGLCISPTCTRESSSDESAQLLVQPFDSSQYSVPYCNKAKEKRPTTVQIQQISHSSRPYKTDKSRAKVSFQGETGRSAATEISSTQMHKQMQFSTNTEAAASSSATRKETGFVKQGYKAPELTSSSNAYKKPISDVDVQPPESVFNLHLPDTSHKCFPLLSSRAAHLVRKGSNSLCKLQNFICRLRQQSLESEDDGGLIRAQIPDTHMDDVNEMKALLNTINNNLKMLETRSRAHPQLLSSKLAPVYFTT